MRYPTQRWRGKGLSAPESIMKRDRESDEDTSSTGKKSKTDQDVATLVATSYKEDDGVIEEGALYVIEDEDPESKEDPDPDVSDLEDEDPRVQMKYYQDLYFPGDTYLANWIAGEADLAIDTTLRYALHLGGKPHHFLEAFTNMGFEYNDEDDGYVAAECNGELE